MACASQIPAANTTNVITSDNCAGPVIVAWLGDVMSASNCVNQFTLSRLYRATDACGNASFCTQLIVVNDTNAPSITCPADVTVTCAANVPAANTNLVTTSDNCGGSVLVTWLGDSISASNCLNQFTITRTYRAVDACGNAATCAAVDPRERHECAVDHLPEQPHRGLRLADPGGEHHERDHVATTAPAR